MKLHPRVTRSLVELVKRFEGLRRHSARLSDGGWTIGYGHTRSARVGAVVTPEDAEALLYWDLSEVAERVEAWTFTPLNQNQFEALTAFAFNIGIIAFRTSSVLKRINEGQVLQAAEALELWRKAEFDGEAQIVDALVRRRAAEKAHFLTPPEGFRPSPSPVLRPLFDPPAIAPSPPVARTSGGIVSSEADTHPSSATADEQRRDPPHRVVSSAAPASSLSAANPDGAAAAPLSPFPSPGAGGLAAPAPGAEGDRPFGHRAEPPSVASFEAGLARVAVAEPPKTAPAAQVSDNNGMAGSPFEPPPPPVEVLTTVDAPFLSAPAMEKLSATTADETVAPIFSPADGELAARQEPPRSRRRSGVLTGRHTLLFGGAGCLGVGFLAAALFSILFSRANPLNLVVGLIGILLLIPAGAFFCIRFLNTRERSLQG